MEAVLEALAKRNPYLESISDKSGNCPSAPGPFEATVHLVLQRLLAKGVLLYRKPLTREDEAQSLLLRGWRFVDGRPFRA